MALKEKISLNYLLIDDSDAELRLCTTNVSLDGWECKPIYIDPTLFFDADTNSFNKDEFINEIRLKSQGININLIICDWNLLSADEEFEGLTGWDALNCVISAKDKLKTRPFLIYSGDINNASKYILDKIRVDIDNGDAIPSLDFISQILKLKLKFCNRDENRFQEIRTLLKDSQTISNIVLDSILKFDKNTIIDVGNKQFDGKRLGDLINENQDVDGLKFVKEFIDLAIANYTELNAKL